MHYTYTPSGVHSKSIEFDIEDNIVKNVLKLGKDMMQKNLDTKNHIFLELKLQKLVSDVIGMTLKSLMKRFQKNLKNKHKK